MTGFIISLIIFVILIGVILAIRWVINFSASPDPWDNEIDKQDLKNSNTPICLNCTKPIEKRTQHYCPYCGNITGEYTRYIPFVNIQFNYSIFETLWNKLNNKTLPIMSRVFYLFLILLCAPIMIIIGIPVKLYYFFKNKKSLI